jgi:hypothetical protein
MMVKRQIFRWTGVDKVMVPLAISMILLWVLVKVI